MSTAKPSSQGIAPGKLILSGEHSVVVGQPAIAVAIEPYCRVTVLKATASNIHFSNNFPVSLQSSAKHLIQTILQHLGQLWNAPLTVNIFIDSDLPIGCGLGSSAAFICAILLAITHEFNKPLSQCDLYELAHKFEHQVHKRSSGIDVHVVLNGGAWFCQNGETESIKVPSMPIYLVHTGAPKASTGECVSHTQHLFKDNGLAKAFGEVSNTFKKCLTNNDHPMLYSTIRKNQLLLQDIGVVPTKVSNFTDQLWEQGIPAKVSGAGSIRGDAAGIVMALGDEKTIQTLAKQQGYLVQKALFTTKGASCVSC